MLTKDDISYIRTHFEFWEYLREEERHILEERMVKVTYSKGLNLHNSGTECLGIILIRTGSMRAYILSEDGREVTLYRLAEDEVCVMSASCVLNCITFDVHIDAESDIEAYLIPSMVFRKLNEKNIYVQNFVYRNTVDRFSDVMWAMEQILFMSLDKRLAIFLLDESAKTGSDSVKMTQEQIAALFGISQVGVKHHLDAALEKARKYF